MRRFGWQDPEPYTGLLTGEEGPSSTMLSSNMARRAFFHPSVMPLPMGPSGKSLGDRAAPVPFTKIRRYLFPPRYPEGAGILMPAIVISERLKVALVGTGAVVFCHLHPLEVLREVLVGDPLESWDGRHPHHHPSMSSSSSPSWALGMALRRARTRMSSFVWRLILSGSAPLSMAVLTTE